MTYIQINYMIYATYTCDRAFHPSLKSLSNVDNLYSWGVSYPADCGQTGHHLWPSPVTIRVIRSCLRGYKSFYFIHSFLFIVFCLNFVQDVTTFFVEKLAIVLAFIIHIILNGCW